MSSKSAKIAAMIESLRGRDLDAHYLGYFECFNRRQYYEAHDVLEELWLADRQGPNGAFYKGLIQMAGAFVHLQKDRLRPADALFRLARANLKLYSSPHERLDVNGVVLLIDEWRARLDAGEFKANPLRENGAPLLSLLGVEG